MPVALLATTNRMVRAEAADDVPGPFKCAQCRIPVDHVGGYWVRKDDPELAREVHAFFRLKKGEEHAENCPYTPATEVSRIVARAEAVEGSINPFEEGKRNGLWIFRLNIPIEEERREAASEPFAAESSYPARVERVWSGQRLESFCRSALGLAKLWQALEGADAQAEVRKHVRLALNGKLIKWEDFFFPPQELGRLADRLAERSLHFPVALLLHLRRITRDRAGHLRTSFTPTLDPSAQSETRIAVDAVGAEQVLTSLRPKQHYIVFGDFWHRKTAPWASADGTKSIVYRNLGIKLFRRSQIEMVEVIASSG